MANLNPTLWRTCKMLAGEKRIQLLRQLHEKPGRSVTELGAAVGVKRSDASQELRRIQSRGLLKSERKGLPLVYRMEVDPQVLSAAPLLKAIQAALASFPPERDIEMCGIANGLAHDRRIAIVRALTGNPLTTAELQRKMNLPRSALAQHLQPLASSGFTSRKAKRIHFKVPPHPLARALAKLLQQVQ
ncbi:MAG: transcriptional regulator [Opitutae bacterium]|nr:transcriptional regulator [Opitutae bacterium]